MYASVSLVMIRTFLRLLLRVFRSATAELCEFWLTVVRIMLAKVIMLMHANGERDSNDGENWVKVQLVIHARARSTTSARG